MTNYFITASVPPNADWAPLVASLQQAGLPVQDVQTSGAYPGQLIVVCSTNLTPTQETQLNSLVAAWDARPRTKRSIYAIYTDLSALSGTQKTNIWNDLNAGTPPKYLLDPGSNAAALAVLDWVVKKSGASQANLLDAQLRATAMYVQDNVTYLVHPAFDATINVLGDMPVS